MFKSPYDPDDIKFLLEQISHIDNDCWCDRINAEAPCRACRQRDTVKQIALRITYNARKPEPFTYEFRNKEQLNALSKINNA